MVLLADRPPFFLSRVFAPFRPGGYACAGVGLWRQTLQAPLFAGPTSGEPRPCWGGEAQQQWVGQPWPFCE